MEIFVITAKTRYCEAIHQAPPIFTSDNQCYRQEHSRKFEMFVILFGEKVLLNLKIAVCPYEKHLKIK